MVGCVPSDMNSTYRRLEERERTLELEGGNFCVLVLVLVLAVVVACLVVIGDGDPIN